MLPCTETVGLTAGQLDVSLWYLVPGDRRIEMDFDSSEFNSIRWFDLATAFRLGVILTWADFWVSSPLAQFATSSFSQDME